MSSSIDVLSYLALGSGCAAVAQAVYTFITRRAAEREFVKVLALRRLNEMAAAAGLEENVSAQIRASLDAALLEIDAEKAELIRAALDQPSKRGRDSFIRKVIRETAEESTRATA